MNISVQKLLAKMEDELQQAKSSQKEESLREKIYSIKILCELILEEQQAKRENAAVNIQPAREQQVHSQHVYQSPFIQQQAPVPQPKKLKLDDGANGDSLFDF